MSTPESSYVDESTMRSVLGHFPTGVVIITATHDYEPVGMTVQSFLSLSIDPPLVLLSVAKTSVSWPRIAAGGRFLVNVLAEHQSGLARQFAQSGADKFAGIGYTSDATEGGPRLDGATAWIDCRTEMDYDGGDHTIVVAKVLGARVSPNEDHALAPLVFHRSGFPRLNSCCHI
jgi:3-hydroxy-9,10-secoandrosta-1,3,5(10)-triene-9,17-dione monooxygenase reductase component